MTDWVTANGVQIAATRIHSVNEVKGIAAYNVPWPCGRCGGAGGSEAWKFTGWTCFECNGSGHRNRVKVLKAYTAESYAKLEMARAKRAATKAAKVAKIEAAKAEVAKAALEVFRTAHIDLLTQLEAYNGLDGFVLDLRNKLTAYGSLTDKQCMALSAALARHAAMQSVPDCPVGRTKVEGEVISTKVQDSQWGTTIKMLVKANAGWKVWLSVPRDAIVERGTKVAFTATLERSSDDPKFCFGKRPVIACLGACKADCCTCEAVRKGCDSMKKVEPKTPIVRSTPLKVSSVAVAKKLGLANVVARSKPVIKPTAKKAKAQVQPPKPAPPRGGKKAVKAKQAITSLIPLLDATSKANASIAKRRAKAAAIVNDEAPTKKLVDADAPHIECKLIVGDLAVKIDASDLAHTLGSGRWGHGLGLVDQWPDAVWVSLLAHLKLPADPLDRVAAEPPVKRLVQRLWYEAVQGGVPEERKAVFEARDTERAKKYKEEFEGVKSGAEGRKERAVKSFGRKGETVYTPTELLKDKKLALGGQQAPLLAFFRDMKFASATTQQATDGMVAHGLKTGTKPERIAAFYLCQWVKKGLLERSTAAE